MRSPRRRRKWSVGDKWVYNVKSGVGISPINYQETREVVSVGGGVTKLKITGKTANGQDFTRVDEYAGPGAMKLGAPCADEVYRFPTPLQRVTFPVSPGQRSAKWVDVINEPGGGKGQVNYGFRTRSWDKQTVPAGIVRRHPVDVTMVLDDSTPFRGRDHLQLHLLVFAGGASDGARAPLGAVHADRRLSRPRRPC